MRKSEPRFREGMREGGNERERERERVCVCCVCIECMRDGDG